MVEKKRHVNNCFSHESTPLFLPLSLSFTVEEVVETSHNHDSHCGVDSTMGLVTITMGYSFMIITNNKLTHTIAINHALWLLSLDHNSHMSPFSPYIQPTLPTNIETIVYIMILHIRHFSFFFCTTTTLANHLRNFTSLIIIVLRSFSTSSWMI